MKHRWVEIGLVLVLVSLGLFAFLAHGAATNTVWPLGKAWVDPGGSVLDNVDGVIPWAYVTITGTVDVTKAGTYTVTYTVADAAGNVGTATRQVTVKDLTGPVITLK